MNDSPGSPRPGWIIHAVVAGICLADVTRLLLRDRETTHSAIYLVALALTLALQALQFGGLNTPARRTALAAQVVLVFLPFLPTGQLWTAVPGLVAGNALALFGPPAGWTVFALVAAATSLLQTSASPLEAVIATTATGLAVSGIALGNVFRPATPPEPVGAALAEERLRVARDLHDLLGYSLSAIKLKSELAHRLIAERPDRAQEHLADILDIAGNALTDVRSLARSYRRLSLSDTSHSAKTMLTAANIDVRVELDHDPLPEEIETVLATVLREAVTNVLRHSEAENCAITVRQTGDEVKLDVVNDGATDRPSSSDCNGVRNQAERVQAAGGVFIARHVGTDRFHVHAAIPIAA
ncbi:sensor histidine kinase [Lentzea aerocolonigenes]|uniref:sensor histidine kinase n=1 Tax=Lentzea aerocolonigenes TaxID=68170 RepID=UPI000AFC2978|nr:histidine kinase [Lentzea aerocolonigenes]MCP2242903.1 Histidine kinase [Lentzea aerocolonigenes]